MRATRRLGPGIIAVAAWLASNLIAAAYAIHFDDGNIPRLWHLLDEEILRGDLLRGVYHLHSQPPLFNLFVGAGLKLFPQSSQLAFAVAYGAMSLALLIAVARLLEQLDVPAVLIAGACVLLALAPPFIVYGHWLHYSLPATLLLCLSAVALGEFLRSGRTRWAHLFSWLAATLMLTRPLYHPVWFVAALAVVVATAHPTVRRRLVASAVVPLMLVNLWYAKNYVQVGSYGASSWLGMHLRRGWVPTPDQLGLLAAKGAPTVWGRMPFLDASHYQDLGYFAAATRDGAGFHPAVDAPFKRNGEPNYNHRDYARLSRDMLAGDLLAMRTYPGFYARRVVAGLATFLQPGPRPIPNKAEGAAIARLAAVPKRILLCGMLAPGDSPNLFFLLFFAPLVFGAMRVWHASHDVRTRPLIAYVTVTMLWLTATVNLIEVGENDRLRFDIDPFMIVLLACTAAWLTANRSTAVRPGAPTPGPPDEDRRLLVAEDRHSAPSAWM